MGTGFSITIAMPTVDPAAYPKWPSVHEYPAAVQNRLTFQTLLSNRYTNIADLVGATATRAGVLAALENGKAQLAAKPGSTLAILYTGHGGFIPDATGSWSPENSFKAWALYDRFLLASELAQIWTTFPSGSRVLLVIDTCYCGSLFSTYPSVGGVTGTKIDKQTGQIIANSPPSGNGSLAQGFDAVYLDALGLGVEFIVGRIPLGEPMKKNTSYILVPNPVRPELRHEYKRLKTEYDATRDSTFAYANQVPPIPVVGYLSCSGDEESGVTKLDPPLGVFTMMLGQAILGGITSEIDTQVKFMTNVRQKVVTWYLDTQNPPQFPQFPQLGRRGPVDAVNAFLAEKPFTP